MSHSPISRRQLLKVLAAAAGTAVLSSVPTKWKTPVVEVGMLPAHAQGLSGLGAIQVTLIAVSPAPIRDSKAPNVAVPCGFAVVSITPSIPLSPHCFDTPGSFTFTNVPTGNYTVHCVVGFCGPLVDQVAHVVAPGTASLTFDVPPC